MYDACDITYTVVRLIATSALKEALAIFVANRYVVSAVF